MKNTSCASTVPEQDITFANQPWRRAFYSIEQIKTLTSISRTTIYREAQAGRLKLSKLAGRTGAMDEDFMAWLSLGEEIKRTLSGAIESPVAGALPLALGDLTDAIRHPHHGEVRRLARSVPHVFSNHPSAFRPG